MFHHLFLDSIFFYVCRRIESAKPSRFFGFGSRKSKIYQPNKFVTQNLDEDDSKQFQDQTASLGCLGDCGSQINKLLLEKTNLEVYVSSQKPQRKMDIVHGRGSRKFYKKLSFVDKNSEERFCALFLQCTEKIAQKIPMGMFKKTEKSSIFDWRLEIQCCSIVDMFRFLAD